MCTSCPGVHNQWSVTAGSDGKALTASLGMIIALWARANKLKSHSARNPVGLQLLCKALKCNYLKYDLAHSSLISFWYVDPYIFNIFVFAEESLLIVMSLSLLECFWVFWVGSRMYRTTWIWIPDGALQLSLCSSLCPQFQGARDPGDEQASSEPEEEEAHLRARGQQTPPVAGWRGGCTEGQMQLPRSGEYSETDQSWGFGIQSWQTTLNHLDLSVRAVK